MIKLEAKCLATKARISLRAKCTIIGNNLSMQNWNDAKENIKCFAKLCLPKCTEAFRTVTTGYEKRKTKRKKAVCLIHTQKRSGVKKPARKVSKDWHGLFSPGSCGFCFVKTSTIYSEIAYFCSYTLVGNGMSDERFH